jgi:hypothetical protein
MDESYRNLAVYVKVEVQDAEVRDAAAGPG